ncbi:MAG: shikimate dehydrogenase [Candidatus Omnitrophica bacterium]|nr:shikimate dehydrogenase [Candidatus Omnitrophota bacterium]
MSNFEKQIYGLIGYPVKHSFSAAMHNAAFLHLGINAEYRLFEVKPEELKGFFSSAYERGIRGFNVTIPHKENAVAFLDEKSFGVAEIGATNTVCVNNDGKFKGFNTDYAGFSRDIKELDVNVQRTALLGAGGAAKAVVFALAKKGAVEIAVFDIDASKSEDLVRKIKQMFPECKVHAVDSVAGLRISEKTFLVNAAPLGMKEDDPLPVKEEMLHKNLFVYDLIYNPAETNLLRTAKEKGLRASNGLKMLLYQGMLAFEHWTGKPAPEKIMFNVLEEALR